MTSPFSTVANGNSNPTRSTPIVPKRRALDICGRNSCAGEDSIGFVPEREKAVEFSQFKREAAKGQDKCPAGVQVFRHLLKEIHKNIARIEVGQSITHTNTQCCFTLYRTREL